MANQFSKEEIVLFEKVLEGFNDRLVVSQLVNKFTPDAQTMERTGDQIWRPMPYIARSVTAAPGVDVSSMYPDRTQLSVPASIGFHKSSLFTMTASQLRDALQEGRLGDAAKQILASDINRSLMDLTAAQGSIVVKRTSAASGYDDVAQIDAAMNEIGISAEDRKLALSSRDYNAMAGNLAARQTMTGKPATAYESAYVGMVSGFETYKLDYANRLTLAAASSITIDTRTSANNFYVPKATVTTVNGTNNVDNRFQTVTFSSTTGMKAGDAFYITGVESCHLITKQGTGQPKTHRIISIGAGNTAVITPPIVSNQGATDAEADYQNCIVTPSATASVVWLNTTTASVNPFWQKDAFEIIPGRYAVPADQGPAVFRATTDQGIELVIMKTFDQDTMVSKFRFATSWGVVCTNTEKAGIVLFGQA